jgi:hypothetical protein
VNYLNFWYLLVTQLFAGDWSQKGVNSLRGAFNPTREEREAVLISCQSSFTTSLKKKLVVKDVQLFIEAGRPSRPALKKAWS